MKIISTVIILLLGYLSLFATDNKNGIMIFPTLGSEFGKVLEIVGTVVDEKDSQMRSHVGRKLVEVNRVMEETLDEPIIVEVRVFQAANLDLFPARGTQVTLRGYETGEFTGIPDEAFADIRRFATTDHHFQSYFLITKILGQTRAEPGDAENGKKPLGDERTQ